MRYCTVVAVLASVVAACTPPIKQFELRDRPLSCGEANRYAYQTLTAMHFTVTAFEPAEPGRRGVLRARREAQGPGERARSSTVAVECSPTGATIDAREDGQWLNQLDFKRAFHHAFTNIVSMTAARASLDAQIAAGTAPASQQRHDLRVVVVPVRGQEAKLDFPFDLAAAGVLPLRVSVANHTARTYTLAVDEIRLTRADRERVAALSPDEAARRIAQAARAAPEPAVPPEPAIADLLRLKGFAAGALPPGAQASGFLYFPLAEYKSARLVFTDAETHEPEGVRVEF